MGGRWDRQGGIRAALGIALWTWVPADVLTADNGGIARHVMGLVDPQGVRMSRVWSTAGCRGGVGSAGAASKVPAGGRGQARPLGQLAELHILFTIDDQ